MGGGGRGNNEEYVFGMCFIVSNLRLLGDEFIARIRLIGPIFKGMLLYFGSEAAKLMRVNGNCHRMASFLLGLFVLNQ